MSEADKAFEKHMKLADITFESDAHEGFARDLWLAAYAAKEAADLAAVEIVAENPPEYEQLEEHGWADACIEIERRIKERASE